MSYRRSGGVFTSMVVAAVVAACGGGSERRSLEALYEATRGTEWRAHDGWTRTVDVCQWHGVVCEKSLGKTGRVVELTLNANNLKGKIPSELGNLDSLSLLSLRDNEIGGPLPETLLRRWESGALGVEMDGSPTGVDEISFRKYLEIRPCRDLSIRVESGGAIELYEGCLARPEPEDRCRVRVGKARGFDLAARWLTKNRDRFGRQAKEVQFSGRLAGIIIRAGTARTEVELGRGLDSWVAERIVLGLSTDADWALDTMKVCTGLAVDPRRN